MLPPDTSDKPYVALVEKLEHDGNNVDVSVRWYYRPEDTIGGRQKFHGENEIFLSDHRDVQSARTIEGKCVVHSYDDYLNLENVGVEDYYCRMEYNFITGAFAPERIDVFCKCDTPHNPDVFMVQCDDCEDWYHPACVGTTIEEVKKTDNYLCPECEEAHNEYFLNQSRTDVSALPTSNGNQAFPKASISSKCKQSAARVV
ncbi:hypothetical protein RIF29_39035 [Crotalaria pallida]|uniref:Uncharacterized protein n=1 Tax=Crotalaria pallida TaxID=3830 RepID=A0AAN9HPG1_CROPI